ncbi:hypothetical protein BT96DRAFT_1008583 [Gymnopus androsaceus JB14]|uniref:Uncharacterized protein n=1 Tax=Gymnopus androsaceus JB14 TaxID=1447944 RepID=A0A6A4GF06_9AGAR|nr:hypothetical protein BT96DRAFT_1008583 [Gymnopus androsaceus JB14]
MFEQLRSLFWQQNLRMSTDTKNAEQPLKNPKLSAEQSSHKSPSATSPSFANSLAGPDTSPPLERRTSCADHGQSLQFPQQCLTDTDDTMSEPSMHASDPDPTVVLEPSLDMELARAKPARQDENPHLHPFERIAPGVSFLRQGHSDNILNAASRDPGCFAAVVPLMGGKEIFAK